MPIRQILAYPDPRLSQKCEVVTDFDNETRLLCDDLLATMQVAPGVGITAAHVGILRRISVIQLASTERLHVHINPEIVSASTGMQRFTEGSVSMPGITDEIERPARITFRYQDGTGAWHEEEADGFLSTCIQHEIDQLNGVFWLKRLSRLKRDRAIKRWEKERKQK